MPVAVCLLAALAAAAPEDQPPVAAGLSWTSLWSRAEPVVLPVTDDPAEVTLELPGWPAGEPVAVRFQARIHTARPAGWNNFLALVLNDTPLDKRLADGLPRVLNRRPTFTTTHPNYPVNSVLEPRGGYPCLQLFFGPADTPVDGSVTSDRREGYWYLLDLTDVGRAEGNRLTLISTARAAMWGGKAPEGLAIVIDHLEVGRLTAAQRDALRDEQYTRRQPLGGASLKLGDAVLTVPPAGGLWLARDGERWFVESGFSYPAERMGFNTLTCLPESEGEPGWRPAVAAGEAVTVTAAGRGYRLERTIRAEGRRFTVRDRVTNLTGEVLGLAVRHTVITGGRPRRTLLNGLDDAGHGPGRGAENPTLFATQERTGLGFLAEDDALRLQAGTTVQTNELTLSTRSLGLAPAETYELRWALYPTGTDCFEMVNQVRRDWRVNFTIDGPWDFFDTRRLATEDGRRQVREELARKRLKLFALMPWFEYYNGWGLTREQFQQTMRSAMTFLRTVVPEAKFLACIETNLCPVPLTFFGDTIPPEWKIGRENGGQYGQLATAAMTARIDASPWRDSVVRDASGKAAIDCWYVQHYRDPPAVNLMTYPTLDNHRHRNMMEQIAWLCDQVGFDGVYIDQFSYAYSGAWHRWTMDRWDGRTVDLDAGGKVIRRKADLALLSAQARAAWVQAVLDRGKVVVANSCAATTALQRLPAFRFMESQGYDPLAGEVPYYHVFAKGQLASPLGLGHSYGSLPHKGAEALNRTVIAHLRFGLLYYYYLAAVPAEGDDGGEYGPINHMFPFTPVELHEGWVLGAERLLTCRSGAYRVPWTREPKVLQFDRRGRDKPAAATVRRDGDGWLVTIRLEDWREIAVVE